MTLDEAFKGSICVCSNWYNTKIGGYEGFKLGEDNCVNITQLLNLVNTEPHNVQIKEIIVTNWSKICDYLQQEKLIKIENGKLTLLF